ncbi:MAG TPA: peroxiredoxin [Anaerolineales bacterium]
MTSNRKALAVSMLVGFAVLAMALGTVMVRAADAPAVGAVAPTFQLSSQEGTPVNLQDFRGKWVVLYFYPKDFTQGCTIEARNFQRDLAQYEQKNAVIVGVSVDNTTSHQEFCTKEGLTFKLLADTEKQVSAQYGSLRETGVAIRNTFIVNPQGRIAKVFLGVQPTPHSAEVLAALAELQAR